MDELERPMTMETMCNRCDAASLEDQGRGPLDAVNQGNRSSLRASRKDCNSTKVYFWPMRPSIGLLTYRTRR